MLQWTCTTCHKSNNINCSPTLFPLLFDRETDKSKFANTDNFIHCEEIIQKAEYLIVTNYRLMYVQRNDMFGIWTVSSQVTRSS